MNVVVPVLIELDYATPIMISLLGPKGAVSSLMAKAMLKYNMGRKAVNPPFWIKGKHSGTNLERFVLPHEDYHRLMPQRLGDTRIYEGRIVHKLADQSTAADNKDKCFVLVRTKIDLRDNFDAKEQEWVDFVANLRDPAVPKPLWCQDLWRIYVALKNRLTIPVHATWMPYLFNRMINDYGGAVKFIEGYVSQELFEVNAQPNIEMHAYELTCQPQQNDWKHYIVKNPNRTKFIRF